MSDVVGWKIIIVSYFRWIAVESTQWCADQEELWLMQCMQLAQPVL